MIENIRSIARSYFQPEMNPAHDWFHVQRVEANADRLVGDHPHVDTTCIRLSVLLHDIGRAKEDRGDIEDHAEWGATESARILDEHDATEETIDAVSHCIRAHRYSNHVTPETTEAKIVSDADNLDALGAVGIARCFTYGGERGLSIHDPALPPQEDGSPAGTTQFNHLHKKILDLPNRMYTDAGRELAKARREFVEEFTQRFEKETAGRYWTESH
ncbi:HD domain-containing protein [Halocatena salina]|uniref:HD domain-containing protein n=1 Tax=Halocatena salina TaxID=2934340 RepID=A0A8U0A5Z7_9EURY|nr:HD domain-containing protein [Halocatena salina]UPM44454.1 HD domain-containing protein [Halocatena salina]